MGKALMPLSVGMGGLIGQGIKYNSQMEQFQVNLTTLLGSADKANALLADLKSMAATTPFETADLINATQTMVGFGIASEDAQRYLGYLGDIAMGDSNKLNGLTLAFAQVQSSGKLMGQDLMQMINQGFNPLLYLSEMTGKSMAELKDEMSQGKISAEMVGDAFAYATSEGQPFYKAMESSSKTVAGRISTLKDNFMTLIGTLTESLLPAFERLIDKAMEIVGWFNNLDEGTKNVVTSIMLIVTASAPVLIALGKIISTVGKVITLGGQIITLIGKINLAINPLVLAIGAISAAVIYLWNTNEDFRKKIIKIWNEIQDTVGGFIEQVKEKIKSLIEAMQPTIEAITMLWEEFCDFIAPLIETTFGFIRDFIKSILDGILAVLDFFIAAFSGDWEGMWDAILSIIETASQLVIDAFNAIWKGIKQIFEPIVDWFKDKFGGILNFFKNIGKDMIQAGKDVINNFLKGLKDAWKSVEDWVMDKVNWVARQFGMAGGSLSDSFSGITSQAKKSGAMAKVTTAAAKASGKNGMPSNIPKMAGGGIVDKETLLVAGEAGKEAIVPLERSNWMDELSDRFEQSQKSSVDSEKVVSKLDELINVISSLKITLNGDAVVGELAPAMDTALGSIYEAKGRGGRSTW